MSGFTLLTLAEVSPFGPSRFGLLPLPSNSEHPLIFAPIACVAALELLLSSGKPNAPVWYSELSGFPARSAIGQHLHHNHLLRGSLCGKNLQLVPTILYESASVAEPMVRTTPPKMDKADASSVRSPTAQALVARLGSKTPNDAPADDDPDLLNFTAALSWIVGWTGFLL
jgi:hypothetical protein